MRKNVIILSLLISVSMLFSACSKSESTIEIEQPNRVSTGDEIYPAKNASAVEKSGNVNGMRYTSTLKDFTQKYNEITKATGGTEFLFLNGWKENGDTTFDTNGIEIQYYYYNEENTNFTATVESETGKIVNIGCGTTMNNFVAQENNINNSDVILRKSAVMAAAVCGFPSSSIDVLQNIFYRTTFENAESLSYQGSIFSLSTQNDDSNSENSLMLLRVFPVTDELKEEWDVPDYETYAASVPVETKS